VLLKAALCPLSFFHLPLGSPTPTGTRNLFRRMLTSTRAFPGLPPPLPPPPAAFMLQALPSVSRNAAAATSTARSWGYDGRPIVFPCGCRRTSNGCPTGLSVPFSQGQGLVSTASHAPTADGEQPLVRIEMNGQWAVRLAGPSLVASFGRFRCASPAATSSCRAISGRNCGRDITAVASRRPHY